MRIFRSIFLRQNLLNAKFTILIITTFIVILKALKVSVLDCLEYT